MGPYGPSALSRGFSCSLVSHTGKYLAYSIVKSEPNLSSSNGLEHRRLGSINDVLGGECYLSKKKEQDQGKSKYRKDRTVGKEVGIDERKGREVWESNHRERE